MHHELVIEAPGVAAQRRRVRALTALGGSLADALHVPGLPPAAIRLIPCAAGVVLVPAVLGLHVGPHPVTAGARRLLRPGEHASVLGVTLALAGRSGAPEDTRAAVAALLRAAASCEPPGPHLLALAGPDTGQRWPLGRDEVVGRGRASTVVLSDGRVSRRHARVRLAGDQVTVEDLGAKNGVRVNGVPVERRRPVPARAGDELTLGDTTLVLEGLASPVKRAAATRPQRVQHAAPRLWPPARLVAAGLLALSAAALALAGS